MLVGEDFRSEDWGFIRPTLLELATLTSLSGKHLGQLLTSFRQVFAALSPLGCTHLQGRRLECKSS